jgi:hypothetical protein
MNVLLIRHDTSGTTWREFHIGFDSDFEHLTRIIKADLNTVGVTRLEIIPEGS